MQPNPAFLIFDKHCVCVCACHFVCVLCPSLIWLWYIPVFQMLASNVKIITNNIL